VRALYYDPVENRNAFFLVGVVFIAAGILVPFLCGIGILFLIIGGIMWARD